MTFANCRNCKKVFNRKKDDLCDSCLDIENLKIKKISAYLEKIESASSKTLSIGEVSRATGVNVEDIETLYKLNKLRSFTGLFDVECKLCSGKFKPSLNSGILCKKCSSKIDKIAEELKNVEISTLGITEKSKSTKPADSNDVQPSKAVKEIKENKPEPAKTSGMHLKEDAKKRCGFKKS